VRTSAPDPPIPLTLSEQLDAMLTGWLERRTAGRRPLVGDMTATLLITVARARVAEFERFCAGWQLAVEPVAGGAGAWAVLRVEGRALPIEGLTEITGMYRRRS
jgi:hypothetical protein